MKRKGDREYQKCVTREGIREEKGWERGQRSREDETLGGEHMRE